MSLHYNGSKPLSKLKIRQIAGSWQPWRTVATWIGVSSVQKPEALPAIGAPPGVGVWAWIAAGPAHSSAVASTTLDPMRSIIAKPSGSAMVRAHPHG